MQRVKRKFEVRTPRTQGEINEMLEVFHKRETALFLTIPIDSETAKNASGGLLTA